MDFFSPRAIRSLLERYGAKPSRWLGQNFLVDRKVLEKILATAKVTSKDIIVEVGPGIGTMTQALAQQSKHVTAIEKDRGMVAILQETLQDCTNVEVVHADVLSFEFPAANYKVVANIPYYLTSPLIRRLLESRHPPLEMTLMVQQEVARRICAVPPDMSLLAVSVQYYAQPTVAGYVSRNCFWPVPEVDSAILKISDIRKDRLVRQQEAFFAVVRAGFSHPRKQLAGNLVGALKKSRQEIITWLKNSSIKPSQRAESLSVADWERLVGKVNP